MATILTNRNLPTPIQGDDYPSFHVEVFSDITTNGLETLINDALAAIPALGNNAVALLDIQHSSAQMANNTVTYSAIISYVTFG